jgi:cytochrome c oxidase subunit 2
MRLDLVVESPDEYATWVRQQQAPIPILTGEAADGEKVFMNGMCSACHTINGTEAEGTLGPNLTHLGSRQDIGGAVMTNSPENLYKWLENPDSVKPGVKMPKPDLSDTELKLLVVFLHSLK